ncbi:hypothetical protein NGI46_29420 [Peribacillus butanolivorans]|nr:hypothetical protein [Peribacillus butanolivorans]
MGPVAYTHLTLPTKMIVSSSVVAGSLNKKILDRGSVHQNTEEYLSSRTQSVQKDSHLMLTGTSPGGQLVVY